MSDGYDFRLANVGDMDDCWRILNEGRAFQREQGFVQWEDGYPPKSDLVTDISLSQGHVLCHDGEVVAYVCLDGGGEAAYAGIKGAWSTGEDAIVLRRIAISRTCVGHGLSRILFSSVDEWCLSNGHHAIRLTTGLQNGRMRHVLEREGYSFRGTVFLRGEDRAAYDKTL